MKKFKDGVIGNYQKNLDVSVRIASRTLWDSNTGSQVFAFDVVQGTLVHGRAQGASYGRLGAKSVHGGEPKPPQRMPRVTQ